MLIISNIHILCDMLQVLNNIVHFCTKIIYFVNLSFTKTYNLYPHILHIYI